MKSALRSLRKQPLLFAWLLLVAVTLILILRSIISLSPDDPRYIAIQRTLNNYLEIDALARYTLDDSQLTDVLANDLRGSYSPGESSDNFLKAVRWYKRNPYIFNTGMLDFWHAYYAFNRQVKQIYDQAIEEGTSSSSGKISPESLPAVKQLMEEAGFEAASLPPPKPDVIVPESFVIRSIKVFLDEAYVVGDYPYARVGLTLINRSGRWYLVGMKILQDYGG